MLLFTAVFAVASDITTVDIGEQGKLISGYICYV